MTAPGCQAYRLLFDVAEAGPPVWFAAFFLVPMAGSIVLLVRARLGLPIRLLAPSNAPNTVNKPLIYIIAGLLALAGLGSAGLVLLLLVSNHNGARRALEDGTAQVVEGPVEAFHPMPEGGHDMEHFTVAGVYFAYSDFVVISGFNQTSSHGGPMHAGMQVRIHYVGQPGHAEILRLESCD